MRSYWVVVAAVLLLVQAAPGQYWAALDERGLTGDGIPRFESSFAVPQLHKWYGPRQLYETYAQPWYARDTFYAKGDYRHFVDRLLEGAQWYDRFGTALGRGWLVYSWTQAQPASRGSIIRKRPPSGLGRNIYAGFFSRLVIASDGDSRSSYRLMVGDEIYTSFTPLTFYKPRFNGMRLDYAADTHRASLILSRPSEPDRDMRTDVTHVMGGHAEWGADLRLGITYVSAHNANTKDGFASGNPMHGILTSRQNQGLQDLWISIRDDSPADGRGGPVVFSYDLVMVDTSGQEIRGSEIGLLPFVEGGRTEGSSLIADGSERIVLHYDLRAISGDLRSINLRRSAVELSLANDYRVEMASDLQTDGERRNPEPVFLTFDRAAGNVGDRSNSTVLRVDYALPTANELAGINWNLVDWKGLSLRGELVVNRRHGFYPSPNISRGYHAVDEATAAHSTLFYRRYPWIFYAEAFSLDDSYATSYWLTEASGIIRYKARVPQLYELVDDDDDADAIPDWERPLQPTWSPMVFPGYDENGDFIYDHNQNRNLQPDYDEPFLRFRSDRPEFLFGLDMNHNGTIDRFEDDDLPDYPYRRDQRGFNAYLKANAGPDMALLLGRQRVRRLAGDGRTRSWYFMWTWTREMPVGRLRLFEYGALVEDDIADPINLWVQPVGAVGRMRRVEDALPGRNTWKNTLYADFEHKVGQGVRLLHRAKWEHWHQRDSAEEVAGRYGRVDSGFLGVINKAEWSIPVGLAVVEPRFKSEYRKVRAFSQRVPEATILEETLFLIWTQPLLAETVGVAYYPRYGRQLFNTELQLGLELTWFRLLDGEELAGHGDFNGWTAVGQFVNRVGYQGYQLAIRAGLRLGQRSFAVGADQRTSLFFLSINAGL